MFTFDTWPDASASALAVQFCSSRKPLPVPPVFEKPMTYCLAACEAGADAPVDDAALLGAVEAPLVQADAPTMAAAIRGPRRARLDALITRSPPLAVGAPSRRR